MGFPPSWEWREEEGKVVGRRGFRKVEMRGKARVPSDLAYPARRRFVERPRRSSGFPTPRLLAFLASALLSARPSPKLGPRARRALAGNPPSLSRAAGVNRQPRSRRSPFGLPLRLRAPVRASRAVKPRSPAPFALRGQTRRTRVARAACVNRPPPAQRLSRLSVRYSPTGRAAFAEAPAPLPATWTGIRVAASQAASGEPPATRSAEPLNSTTWDSLNTTPESESCQAFFQANFGNLQN